MVRIPPEQPRIGGTPTPEEKRVAPDSEVFKSSHLSPPKAARTEDKGKISAGKKEQVFGTLANIMVKGASADKFVQIAAAMLQQIRK